MTRYLANVFVLCSFLGGNAHAATDVIEYFSPKLNSTGPTSIPGLNKFVTAYSTNGLTDPGCGRYGHLVGFSDGVNTLASLTSQGYVVISQDSFSYLCFDTSGNITSGESHVALMKGDTTNGEEYNEDGYIGAEGSSAITETIYTNGQGYQPQNSGGAGVFKIVVK